jgi:hypothetical protein
MNIQEILEYLEGYSEQAVRSLLVAMGYPEETAEYPPEIIQQLEEALNSAKEQSFKAIAGGRSEASGAIAVATGQLLANVRVEKEGTANLIRTIIETEMRDAVSVEMIRRKARIEIEAKLRSQSLSESAIARKEESDRLARFASGNISGLLSGYGLDGDYEVAFTNDEGIKDFVQAFLEDMGQPEEKKETDDEFIKGFLQDMGL